MSKPAVRNGPIDAGNHGHRDDCVHIFGGPVGLGRYYDATIGLLEQSDGERFRTHSSHRRQLAVRTGHRLSEPRILAVAAGCC